MQTGRITFIKKMSVPKVQVNRFSVYRELHERGISVKLAGPYLNNSRPLFPSTKRTAYGVKTEKGNYVIYWPSREYLRDTFEDGVRALWEKIAEMEKPVGATEEELEDYMMASEVVIREKMEDFQRERREAKEKLYDEIAKGLFVKKAPSSPLIHVEPEEDIDELTALDHLVEEMEEELIIESYKPFEYVSEMPNGIREVKKEEEKIYDPYDYTGLGNSIRDVRSKPQTPIKKKTPPAKKSNGYFDRQKQMPAKFRDRSVNDHFKKL